MGDCIFVGMLLFVVVSCDAGFSYQVLISYLCIPRIIQYLVPGTVNWYEYLGELYPC